VPKPKKSARPKHRLNRRREDDSTPPWDDADLDERRLRRTRRAKTNQTEQISIDCGEWALYKARVDAHGLIVRNILRAFVGEELVAKRQARRMIRGAATFAEQSGDKAVAREVRRIRSMAFPRRNRKTADE
jgi:hypothetical protein